MCVWPLISPSFQGAQFAKLNIVVTKTEYDTHKCVFLILTYDLVCVQSVTLLLLSRSNPVSTAVVF